MLFEERNRYIRSTLNKFPSPFPIMLLSMEYAFYKLIRVLFLMTVMLITKCLSCHCLQIIDRTEMGTEHQYVPPGVNG